MGKEVKDGIIFRGIFCPVGSSLNVAASANFFHGAMVGGVSRCLKASCHDVAVVVYDKRGKSKVSNGE